MEFKISVNNVIGFFLLITIIVMEVKISLQQHCLPKITSEHGYALTVTQFRTFDTEDYPTCVEECKKDERCMSLNFHLVTKKCELNRQTNESLPEYYKQRPNSIYTTNTAFRTPEPAVGLSQSSPAKSCLEILNKGCSIGTGEYWIDPASTGTAMRAYCDMDTDGGGWTIVKRTVLQTTTLPNSYPSFHDLSIIAETTSNRWVVPKVQAMMDVKNKMGFHQIHYYCHKKSVGRVLSIMTKNDTAGQAVVTFLTGPSRATVFPTACGSFDRLPDDTSILSQNCARWGTASSPGYGYGPTTLVNQWGFQSGEGAMRPAMIPFCLQLTTTAHFWGSNNFATDGIGYRYLCDDSYYAPAEPYNDGDIWQISVR